jgi:pectate lyase
LERGKYLKKKQMQIILIAIILFLFVALTTNALFGYWGPGEDRIGTGNLITRNFSFTNFTRVDIGPFFEALITQSDSFSISVIADDALFDRYIAFDQIHVSNAGNTLKIWVQAGSQGISRNFRLYTLKINITMPYLEEMKFSGSAQGNVTGFTSSNDFKLNLHWGSNVTLQGSTDNITIYGSGSSQLELSNFQVHNATIKLIGGTTVNIDGRLDADLSGGSHLWYIGNPILGDIKISESSTLEEK